MTKNYLNHTLWLLLLVFGFLTASSFLPSFELGPIHLQQVDLLSDIRKEFSDTLVAHVPTADSLPDTSQIVQPKPELEVNPCPPGITCLEDYSPGKKMMRPFFRALANRKSAPVRIAFYGDSFIEGDIITESLRDTLQELYGGRGVGYVPLASEVTQYRLSILHTYEGWNTYSLVSKQKTGYPLGISGYAFVPAVDNRASYRPGRNLRPKTFDQVRVFYMNHAPATLGYHINDTLTFHEPLPVSDSLQHFLLEHEHMKSLTLNFTGDSLVAYGVSFENGSGVYVDNYAMRGNSGMALSSLSEPLMQQFHDVQNYKLIFLQYGLNIVTERDTMNYVWYQSKMIKVVEQLKTRFPGAGIILMGISDRAGNSSGKLQTIPAIKRMRDTQRNIAKRSQVAFWDLFEAMGGENSIISYVDTQPPLAAKDYTHLTFRGGELIARKLAQAMLFEKNRYENKPLP